MTDIRQRQVKSKNCDWCRQLTNILSTGMFLRKKIRYCPFCGNNIRYKNKMVVDLNEIDITKELKMLGMEDSDAN